MVKSLLNFFLWTIHRNWVTLFGADYVTIELPSTMITKRTKSVTCSEAIFGRKSKYGRLRVLIMTSGWALATSPTLVNSFRWWLWGWNAYHSTVAQRRAEQDWDNRPSDFLRQSTSPLPVILVRFAVFLTTFWIAFGNVNWCNKRPFPSCNYV